MKYEYYDKLINKKTVGRYDVTSLFENPKVFNNLIKDLIKPFKKINFDKIAGLDALGFALGGAMALKTKKGFVHIRKGGKLPGVKGSIIGISFKDYSKKEKRFEMNKESIKKGDKVLIVDEWIETGSQAKAAIKLIERRGGKVVGIATISANKNQKTENLFAKYNLKPINMWK